MPRLYFLLLILLSSVSTLAQGLPGYVLTLSGDTVPGFIVEKKRQLIYLYPAGERRQVYRSSQIQGYGLLQRPAIRSRVVRLASGADSVRFVLPQQTGPISLYSFANETGLLLQPSTADTLYELTATNWHLLLIRHLDGCPALLASPRELLKLHFTPKNVEEFVQRYNRCAAPEERPAPQTNNSPWRHSLGLRVGGQRVAAYTNMSERFFNDERGRAVGWSQSVGLEWTAVRANGVQTGLSASFSHQALTSRTYTEPSFTQPPTEWRDQSSIRLLGLAISAGKRLGYPGRLNFYVGGTLGSGFALHATSTTLARPAGSAIPFKQVESYSEFGRITPVIDAAHLNLEAGVLLPVFSSSELRLTAIYQKYLINMHAVGVQVSYHWFRK